MQREIKRVERAIEHFATAQDDVFVSDIVQRTKLSDERVREILATLGVSVSESGELDAEHKS